MELTDPRHREWYRSMGELRDMVLGQLILVSQIPAETFRERTRAEFVLNRFGELELDGVYMDEAGNVSGVIKGRSPGRKVLLCASMDTHFDDAVDHNVSIHENVARGAGIANNSMGLAALLCLPEIIGKLGVEFDSDLIFLATTKSLGKGDLQGMRFFVETCPFNLDFVVNLVGTSLGRVDHFCYSTVRIDVHCIAEEPGRYPAGALDPPNAIIVLNELIDSLLRIPMSRRPKTSLNVGMIRGGESYSTPCPVASLHLYVRSEDDAMTDRVMASIRDCCTDVGSKNDVDLKYSFFGRQHASGLGFAHPFVKRAARNVELLGFVPVVSPTNTQITVPLSKGIPSLSLGVTTGAPSLLPEGFVEINNIPKGLLQVLMLLDDIENGLCDD